MPDWAIVLVAAFGGGLAGAVLEPVVTYWLGRIRAAEQRLQRRRRTLRRMLSARIAFGRHTMARQIMVFVRLKAGTPMDQAEKNQLLLEGYDNVDSMPPWEPERIDDIELRGMAERYNQALGDLLWQLAMDAPDKAECDRLSDELEGLQQRIIGRMDELNWPEVDD